MPTLLLRRWPTYRFDLFFARMIFLPLLVKRLAPSLPTLLRFPQNQKLNLVGVLPAVLGFSSP